jgi:hypothetical protein
VSFRCGAGGIQTNSSTEFKDVAHDGVTLPLHVYQDTAARRSAFCSSEGRFITICTAGYKSADLVTDRPRSRNPRDINCCKPWSRRTSIPLRELWQARGWVKANPNLQAAQAALR